jgi:hypothetical protein
MDGTHGMRPTHIFHNGKHTYFQFRLFLMTLQCFGSPSCCSFTHRRPLRSSTFSILATLTYQEWQNISSSIQDFLLVSSRWAWSISMPYPSSIWKILRAEVATELMKSTSYVNTNLAPNDERIVHVTLPTATKAVILHAQYIKDEGQTFMLEATLLQVGGVPHGHYSKVIFDIAAITKYLVRGKHCLFVSFSAQKVNISSLPF